MNRISILFGVYIFAIISLFFYSFTQVDLGLTLTRITSLHDIQREFQYLGYFHRPLSTLLFMTMVTVLFILYGLFLYLSDRGKLAPKYIWRLIIFTAFLLTFSYNAFSYDFFNYIFDAKIVTYYNQSPYEHKALDYLGDPMLGFMHWTHRIYPYGPLWLILTVPLSYIGFQVFLLTFLLFKVLSTAAFLGTALLIEKILNRVNPKYSILGLVFFSFNPLILVESLVSAHNDMVMIFFAFLALYLLIIKKYVRSFILLIMSISIKFATLFLVPVFFWVLVLFRKKKSVNWRVIFFSIFVIMVIPVVAASMRTNFQPWYLLYVIPFASLLVNHYYVFIPSIVFSVVAVLYYVPFLYYGNWNDPTPVILYLLLLLGAVISLFLLLLFSKKKLQVIK